MKRKTWIVSLALSAAAFLFALAALTVSISGRRGDVQYVVYLGTNDKDTYEMPMTRQEAHEMAEKILLRYFEGYTIQEAQGGWVDGDTVFQEFTLVIYLSDTTLKRVHAAAQELITAFNQNSVLIQQNRTVTEFYSGS